jgi:thermostable 8-oxoguanine DNA glycosylase
MFYDYYDNEIALNPEALRFFKTNYHFLSKSVILEWVKFLERINYGLPKLISKIEDEEAQRSSLEKVKGISMVGASEIWRLT